MAGAYSPRDSLLPSPASYLSDHRRVGLRAASLSKELAPPLSFYDGDPPSFFSAMGLTFNKEIPIFP